MSKRKINIWLFIREENQVKKTTQNSLVAAVKQCASCNNETSFTSYSSPVMRFEIEIEKKALRLSEPEEKALRLLPVVQGRQWLWVSAFSLKQSPLSESLMIYDADVAQGRILSHGWKLGISFQLTHQTDKNKVSGIARFWMKT